MITTVLVKKLHILISNEFKFNFAELIQMAEILFRNQEVTGSSPVLSSKYNNIWV